MKQVKKMSDAYRFLLLQQMGMKGKVDRSRQDVDMKDDWSNFLSCSEFMVWKTQNRH